MNGDLRHMVFEIGLLVTCFQQSALAIGHILNVDVGRN